MRAAWLVLLAACGGADEVLPSYDAEVPGRVTVTTYRFDGSGEPIGDRLVIASEPGGAIAATARTGDDGVAAIVVPEGGSVTVGYTASAFFTVLGVAEGDELAVGAPAEPGGGDGGFFEMGFTVPAAAGAATYRVFAGCSGGSGAGPVVNVFVDVDCAAETRVFAVGFDAAHAPVASMLVEDVALARGTTADLPDAWQPAAAVTASYTGVPAGLTSLEFDVWFERSGAVPCYDGATVAMAPASSLVLTEAFAAHCDYLTVATRARRPGGSQTVYAGPGGLAQTWSYDLGDVLLPWLGDAALDLDARTIAWTVEGAPAGDLAWAWIGGEELSWEVIAPPGTTSMRLPDLPPDATPPTATDDLAIRLYDLSERDGYDAVRGNFFFAGDLGIARLAATP